MRHNRVGITLIRLILVLVWVSVSCNLINHLPGATTEAEPTQLKQTEPSVSETPVEPVPPTATEEKSPVPLSQGPLFAVFEESPGEVTALLKQEKITPDLSNVRNPFVLSAQHIEKLGANGFVVSPGDELEFFALYEKARYRNEPIFITSDSLLHSYHLMFDKTLRVAEENHFVAVLQSLNQAMLAKSDEIFQQLRGSSWEEPARRNVAYFGVASKLMDANVQVPDYVRDMVEQELSLIYTAAGISQSVVFPGLESGEDYTQYIPRGHYTRSEILSAYFKSMMWYGRMTFRAKGASPETGREETRSALLLVYALRNAQVNGQPALQAWADLYAPTVFFVGRSDDLTVIQYGDVINFVYGGSPGLQDLTNESYLDQTISLIETLPPPKILGMVIQDTDNEEDATKGLRFMGQRFVPDAYIFRQLIYRNVGTRENRRGLPKGLDLFAAMGSERAYQYLNQMGDTQFENYPAQMEKVRSWLSSLTVPEWTETLNNAWLYSFYPLLEQPGEGYPDFMRSPLWLDKQLNTTLGSWAELKHDTILYAKQVYAEMGGGPPPPPPLPPRGYVEPVPEFFNRLAALTAMTRTGLESRGLLSEPDREGLGRLEDLARACQVMAEKELRGELLSDGEYERIRYYGGELEKLVILSADMDVEMEGIGTPVNMAEDQQAAVIADVATDPAPSGSSEPVVLEVGVGRINEIYAVVPVVDVDGQPILQVAKGGVFTYYEFPWPAADRLTDEKWRQMLQDGNAPGKPEWMNGFIIQDPSYSDLSSGVRSFQNNLTNIYWEPAYYVEDLSPILESYRAELNGLAQAHQYIGHQLINMNFRSIDLQSATRAVVTVRETWKDQLYAYSGEYPNHDEPVMAERGPYPLDVTYVLEFVQEPNQSYWNVVQYLLNNAVPAW